MVWCCFSFSFSFFFDIIFYKLNLQRESMGVNMLKHTFLKHTSLFSKKHTNKYFLVHSLHIPFS